MKHDPLDAMYKSMEALHPYCITYSDGPMSVVWSEDDLWFIVVLVVIGSAKTMTEKNPCYVSRSLRHIYYCKLHLDKRIVILWK